MSNSQTSMDHFERPDPVLTNQIVTRLKSQGIFDQFRRECMADVDTKPAYLNLRQRVEGSVAAFLKMNPWRPDMNKNQLRDNLRKHIQSGGFLDVGVDRIVDQVVNPKIYTVFLPKVEEIVQSMKIENDKPKFESLPNEAKPEPSKFQDKHNLAPRAKLSAPLMGPMLKPLNPIDQEDKKQSPAKDEPIDTEKNTNSEEKGDKKFVVDGDELEDKDEDEEDDEESPPFEPHSEGDKLILGMRSDSSENSTDSQLVTTIVDDHLEERIYGNETEMKDESDKKDEDSSSDEYVPKTPTINMEESDGTVLEFNSITEYKEYQAKFEEESLGNVEEIVESQSINDKQDVLKEDRSIDQDNYANSSNEIKSNIDSYDDASSSSTDKESTGDEIKPAVFESFVKKRIKLEEYGPEHDTSELSNDPENEDSYTEIFCDVPDSKVKVLEDDTPEKSHSSENYHSINRESLTHIDSEDKNASIKNEKKSKTKKDAHKKSESNVDYRECHKAKDERRSKFNEKETKSYYDEEKGKNKEQKSKKFSNRERKENENSRNESGHGHFSSSENKTASDHYKGKNKNKSRDRNSELNEDKGHKKTDRNKRIESNHYSSSKHSHQSSSEKHRFDNELKHKRSHDKYNSQGKKEDKHVKEQKKKYRHHCKYNSDKDENRRSSDRDSSGPGESTRNSDSSMPRSSVVTKEANVDNGERTTSNSDNTVSDCNEDIVNSSKYDTNSEIKVHTNVQIVEDLKESNRNGSKEEEDKLPTGLNICGNERQYESLIFEKNLVDKKVQNTFRVYNQQVAQESYNHLSEDFVYLSGGSRDFSIISGKIQEHDVSSEKENVVDEERELINNSLFNAKPDEKLDDNSIALKFKKPKIANNIHEVKKIMEARRHMRRMEKKRIKLLLNKNHDGYESDGKSSSENKSEDEYQNPRKSYEYKELNKTSGEKSLNEGKNHVFRGFPNDFSKEKSEKYNLLTSRLENEILELRKLMNYDQINSNLVTSWIELNPKFDHYIENTLNGKVHRRYRMNIPPISDDYYNYDPQENVYFLIENWDLSGKKDTNFNNNSVSSADLQENISYNLDTHKRKNSKSNKRSYFNILSSDKDLPMKKVALCNVVKEEVENEMLDDGRIIAPLLNEYNITFNQTYDEVLKEKGQNSQEKVEFPKREIEEVNNIPRTVVKITNDRSSEQVFMKPIQSSSEDKIQVPRIKKSETFVNGKILAKSLDSNRFPFISRITKEKSYSINSTTKTKHHEANGDETSTFEEDYPMEESQEIINDVAGITLDQGNISDQSSQSGEEVSERKRRRIGCRQQRYDSSDLYKPRLQLSSRRGRGAGSSPEECRVPPVVISISSRKRRAVKTDLDLSNC